MSTSDSGLATIPRGAAPRHRFFVTAARGTEGALRREIAALRIAGARGDNGGVWFEGPLEMGFAVCLHARVAMRVLMEVARFDVDDGESLYAGVRTVDWLPWFGNATTLAVAADVRDAPGLRHSGFAALKVKDAVVDVLRDARGSRPNVEPRDPDVAIRLHVQGREAKLFVDLAGEPLHRRGYRVAMTDAPLKETLAAAVLALGRVDLDRPVFDPMCGSGTLAIEHALAARRIAPGLGRRFGFHRWPFFASEATRKAWDRLKEQARADVLPAAPAPILCGDRFPDAIEAARRNAAAARVARDITFEVADARELQPPAVDPGNLVMNPPYGERLMGAPGQAGPYVVAAPPPRPPPHTRGGGRPPQRGARAPLPRDEHVQQLKLAGLYRGLAMMFDRFKGWGVVVLSGNPLWTDEIRRRPLISHRLFNGPLEVRLLRYEL